MLVTFLIFATVVLICLVVALAFLYTGNKNVTTAPGMAPSDDKLGNIPDIQVSLEFEPLLNITHCR